ncbi:MAG: multidrug effflux MFS transporter [Simkaniaceae bacterium]|nr:multidrug effflux MFS transporter [Simkaniaceae bacterium]
MFQKKTFYLAILFVATIGLIVTDLYLPSMPAIARDFDVPSNLVQYTLSFYLLTYSISQLFYGPASERFGRKPLIFFGIVTSLIGSGLCLFSWSITPLIVGRILQGLSLGTQAGIVRAIMRDSFQGDELAKTASFVAVGAACAMAIAPTVGGFIQLTMGWRFNFLVIFLYSILGVIAIWRWLPETLQEKNLQALRVSHIFKNYITLLKSPIYMAYTLCGCLSFAGILAFFTVSPFLFQKTLGLSAAEYGLLPILLALGLAIGGVINSIFVRKFGRHHLLVCGVVMLFLGGLSMLVLSIWMLNTWAIMLPMFLYTVGVGTCVGSCNAGALHGFAAIAGFAGSLYGMVQIFGSSLLSFLAANLDQTTALPLACILTATGITTFLLQKIPTKVIKAG